MNVFLRQLFLLGMFVLFWIGVLADRPFVKFLVCTGAVVGAIWVLFFAERKGR